MAACRPRSLCNPVTVTHAPFSRLLELSHTHTDVYTHRAYLLFFFTEIIIPARRARDKDSRWSSELWCVSHTWHMATSLTSASARINKHNSSGPAKVQGKPVIPPPEDTEKSICRWRRSSPLKGWKQNKSKNLSRQHKPPAAAEVQDLSHSRQRSSGGRHSVSV